MIGLLALLLAELLVLWAGQRMLYSPIRARLGKFVSYLLIMPGTVLHELSHWIACKLLFVPTGKVVLFRPQENEDGSIVFGYVEHAESDPLRGALVAVAPVLLVPALMWGLLVAIWGTGLLEDPRGLLDGFTLSDIWKIPLSLYLLLAARGAFPSPGDRIGVLGAGALLALGGVIVWLVPLSTLLQGLQWIAVALLLPALVSLFLLLLLRWGK